MVRRRMCYRGCGCDPCVTQRERDNSYPKSRHGSENYKSRQSAYRRAQRFGITVQDVVDMEEAQGNLCAICNEPETTLGPTGKTKSLSIDHDHESGRIRGLLCNNCNRGIGLLGDDPERLHRAADYIEGMGW